MPQNRISQLRQLMKINGLDAIALNPSPNMIYLTGLNYHLFERPVVIIIPLVGEIISILPEFEVGKLANSPLEIKPFPYNDNPATWGNTFQTAASYLNLKTPKIGLDPIHFRFLEYHYLQKSIPSASLIPAGDLISSLRICKDSEEIEFIQQAVKIAQDALKELLPWIKPGLSEREIARELSILLLRAGSDPDNQFDPIIASGPNSANPHHTPCDRKIEKGDPIVVDWGARYHGYYSDLTRNLFMGIPNEKYTRIFDAVKNGNRAGRECGKPGLPAGKVDQTTRYVIDTLGYGDHFTHRTGHGLGMEEHEPVYIFGDNSTELQPGMVYTVEPGIYLPGKFGVRIEDDVLVTADGCRSLSDYSRELIILY